MYRTEIAWYAWVILGGILSLYMNSNRTRHVCHWLTIKALRVWIWILQKTDHYYHEPEPAEPKAVKPRAAKVQKPPRSAGADLEMDEDELAKLLAGNRELSVSEK